MTYAEKLKDQRWQKKRLELLQAAGWKCQSENCQSDVEKPTLHVHHKLYLRKHDPWDYPDFAYMVVCDLCHEVQQDWMEKRAKALAENRELEELVNGIISQHLRGSTNQTQANAAALFLSAVSAMAPLRPDLFQAAAYAVHGVQEGLWASFMAGLHNDQKRSATAE